VDTDYTGKTGHVYGWGSTQTCPLVPSFTEIREVSVPILSDSDCEAGSGTANFLHTGGVCINRTRSYSGLISEDMMCAGETGKNQCQGDSGGPLTVKKGDQHFLAGVVSWGFGCGVDGLPGVLAEVAKLRTWVDRTIAANGGSTYCLT